MASSAWGFNTAGIASATSPGLVQAGGYNVLPAGTVLPYAGGTAPAGFLICDGTEISKTTYAQLYAAIADAYATQTNPTTGALWLAPSASNFRVPDYRGSFLRGVGTALSKDATTLGGYQAEKTTRPTTAFTSGAMSANSTHSHVQRFTAQGAGGPVGWGGTSTFTTWAAGTTSDSNMFTETKDLSHTHTITGGGDNETRPLNKGVNYIIKY